MKNTESILKNIQNLKKSASDEISNDSQKSGINKNELSDFYNECIKLNLDIIGTMCLPPIGNDPSIYFSEMKKITNFLNLKEHWMLYPKGYQSIEQ